MPIEIYPNIAKVKRNGVYQNLPGFVQASGDTDIEAMIANSETSTTAQFSHDAGSYFILNDILYKAIINIAINDIIAVGTNCKIAILSDDVEENAIAINENANNIRDLGNEIDSVDDEIKDIGNIAISGYQKAFSIMDSTFVDNYYIDTSGNPVSTTAWAYCYTNVETGKKYRITGVAGTGGRLYVVKDKNGNVIDSYQSEVNINHVDLEYTAPENAAVLYVNTIKSRFAKPVIKGQTYDFVNTDIGGIVNVEEQGSNVYKISCGSYVYTVNLFGSNNGTFTITDLKDGSDTFKAVSDDITPISIGTVGYIGANHGYAWVYSCTITGHGLTIADIGKTSTDDTNTWVLIQVTDANTIVVGCYDADAWFKLKRVAPTTLDFNENSLTVESSVQAQLYPSVKNISISIDSNDTAKCVVTESYEIIDVGSGIEAIKTNVGTNNNKSIAERASSIARVNNSYEFLENGSIVDYTSVKILKTGIVLNYLALGIQSAPFTLGGDSIWIPQLTGYDGVIPENDSEINFSKTSWKDSSKPPQVYIQLNGNALNATKSMILGYIINEERVEGISNSAGFVSTAGKVYPYFIQPSDTVEEITEYSTISFRIPQRINRFVSLTGMSYSCGYTYVGNDIYLFINTTQSNGNIDFPLPDFMQRKKIETIMSKQMTCESKITTKTISLSYTTRGSIVLRLYD